MDELHSVIGQNVARYRQRCGLSQEKLAELADVHRNSVGALERGEQNVSVQKLAQIADVLGVDPFVLLISREDRTASEKLNDHLRQ